MSLLARGIRSLAILLINLYVLGAIGLELAWRLGGDEPWPLALLMLFSQWWLLPAFVLAPATFLAGWRRSALGLALVALLFLGVYGQPFLGAPEAPPDRPRRLTVATMNVGAYRVEAPDIEVAVRSTDADLVVMQEIVDSNVPALREALATDYPYQIYRGGKGVLSRWPLGEPRLFETARSPGRPHLELALQLGERSLVLLAPHPYPPTDVPLVYGDGSYHPHPNSRADAAELAARAAATGLPTLLVGDLNLPMRSPAYRAIRSAGLRDAFQAAGDGFGATWPAGIERFGLRIPPLVRIDYVWHTAEFTPLEAHTGAAYGSDHLPVVVTLAW